MLIRRHAIAATVGAALGAVGMVASGAFAAQIKAGTLTMAAGTSVAIKCPNVLTNSGVAVSSETVNCAAPATTTTVPKATTTTVAPTTTTAPAPTTTVPSTTTTVPSGGTACVITNSTGGDNATCDYPTEPYITIGGVQGSTWVGPNVWSGDPGYKFSLTSYAPNNWSTTVNVNTGFGGVEAYSNTGWGSENTADNALVDGYTQTTSSWSVTMPTDDTKVAGWAAYDLWFNDWNDEVMIVTDVTANSFYDCDAAAETTFGGVPWHLCVFGSERVWKIGAADPTDNSAQPYNEASGSIDVKAMLDYMMAHGFLPANSKWTGGSFGFEIADTEGTSQTFAVNNFTWNQS